MTATPFFGPGTSSMLAGLIRRGFATVLGLADPPVYITLYRLNETTGAYEQVIAGSPGTTEVALKFGTLQAENREDDTVAVTSSRGDMRAWSPWDIQIGDVFTLPDGRTGRVEVVEPERYGIVRANWRIDEGSAG